MESEIRLSGKFQVFLPIEYRTEDTAGDLHAPQTEVLYEFEVTGWNEFVHASSEGLDVIGAMRDKLDKMLIEAIQKAIERNRADAKRHERRITEIERDLFNEKEIEKEKRHAQGALQRAEAIEKLLPKVIECQQETKSIAERLDDVKAREIELEELAGELGIREQNIEEREEALGDDPDALANLQGVR